MHNCRQPPSDHPQLNLASTIRGQPGRPAAASSCHRLKASHCKAHKAPLVLLPPPMSRLPPHPAAELAAACRNISAASACQRRASAAARLLLPPMLLPLPDVPPRVSPPPLHETVAAADPLRGRRGGDCLERSRQAPKAYHNNAHVAPAAPTVSATTAIEPAHLFQDSQVAAAPRLLPRPWPLGAPWPPRLVEGAPQASAAPDVGHLEARLPSASSASSMDWHTSCQCATPNSESSGVQAPVAMPEGVSGIAGTNSGRICQSESP